MHIIHLYIYAYYVYIYVVYICKEYLIYRCIEYLIDIYIYIHNIHKGLDNMRESFLPGGQKGALANYYLHRTSLFT